MHSSRSSSIPTELRRERKEKREKKIIKSSSTYPRTIWNGQNPRQSFWIHVHLPELRQWKGLEEYIPIHTGRQKEIWIDSVGQSKQKALFPNNCRKLRSLVLLALVPHVHTCHFVGGTNVIPDQPIRIQCWVRGWPNVNNGQSKLLKMQI